MRWRCATPTPSPTEQKVIWLEQHAFATFLGGGLAEAAATLLARRNHVAPQARRLARGKRDLRWLSQAVAAGPRHRGRRCRLGVAAAGTRRRPEPAAGLVPAEYRRVGRVWGFDPTVADYADRAITVGTQLGDDGVVVRARGLAAFARVLHTDAGWDELEAAWRDAVATDAVGATAAMLGAVMCYAAALHYDPDRADRYVAETVGVLP